MSENNTQNLLNVERIAKIVGTLAPAGPRMKPQEMAGVVASLRKAAEEAAKAKEEAQKIIDLATKRRNEILESVQAEAEVERQRIIEQGRAEVESERKRVQEELRQKVAALAVAGAEKIVGRSIDEAANNDIIDKLVAEL